MYKANLPPLEVQRVRELAVTVWQILMVEEALVRHRQHLLARLTILSDGVDDPLCIGPCELGLLDDLAKGLASCDLRFDVSDGEISVVHLGHSNRLPVIDD